MGSMYLMIGLGIASMTWFVPNIGWKEVKFGTSVGVYVAVVYLVYFAMQTFYWKTGLIPNTYLFQR